MYKNLENGRSMIEMLGVLAIIAVLSVGGIAGYSKAMEMYKVNKLIGEYSHLIVGAKEVFNNPKLSKGYWGGGSGEHIFRDLGYVPDTWKGSLYDSAGNIVWLYAEHTNADGTIASHHINIYPIGLSGRARVSFCRALFLNFGKQFNYLLEELRYGKPLSVRTKKQEIYCSPTDTTCLNNACNLLKDDIVGHHQDTSINFAKINPY